MLALKRARPRLALFAATFGVVFLLAALAVGLSGYLASSATQGARAGIAALTGGAGGFRITIPLARDAAAQDARVQSEIRTTVRADGERVALRIVRDVETPAAVELDGTRGVVRSALASIPGLEARASLVQGAWPSSAAQASMQADAASALHVRVGDRYRLPGGSTITIVGTWRVKNAGDPVWLGAGVPISGLGYAGLAGFVVIDPSLWHSVGSAAQARWTVLPVADAITSTQLSALQAAPDTVPSALLADPRNGTSVDQDGRLQPAMAPIVSNVQAASAVSIAPLVVVAVLGIVTLIELARMLSQLRAGENELIRARGATRQWLVLSAALEGAVVATPAAGLGSLAAAAILPSVSRAAPVPSYGWVGAAGIAAIAVVILALAALSSGDDVPRTAARGARVRSTVGITLVSLTVLAAVLSVSQFVQYGSPLTTTASGAVAVDPLAVAAPALGLAALSLIGLALFPLVSRAAERVARSQPGLGSLPVRQLARRDRASVTPVLLVALAVGGLIFASTYSGTWTTSAAQTRAVHVGTGVRVTEQPSIPAAETRPVTGQLGSAAAGEADVQVGDSLVPMMELQVSHLHSVVPAIPGIVDPDGLARTLANKVALPRIPAGTRDLTVSFAAHPASAKPTRVTLTVVDAVGALSTLLGTETSKGFTVSLPRGAAPWIVRAIDLTMPVVHNHDSVTVALSSASSGAAIPLGANWTLSDFGDGHPGFRTLDGSAPGVEVTASIDGTIVRLQPRAARGVSVPLVITTALAKSAGLHVGSTLELPVVASGGDLPAVVTGIVPVIPGLAVDEGILADLGAVQDSVLREGLHNTVAGEWWVATSAPKEAAKQLASRSPIGAVIQTRDTVPADEVLGSANTVVWIAAAAIALLGMLAVAAGLIAELRSRLGEVRLLRALGVDRRAQARGRILEIGILLALGFIAGVVDGVVISALIVPDLARTAVPGALEALPTSLAFDVVPGVGAVLAVVLVSVGLLCATAIAVARQANRATAGEGRR